MWLLGIEPGFSGRTAGTLYHEPSPAPLLINSLMLDLVLPLLRGEFEQPVAYGSMVIVQADGCL